MNLGLGAAPAKENARKKGVGRFTPAPQGDEKQPLS
tara:strand:- start:970 stop:1077 length:108 start_codon:yes stop_codon:yes gene_type:complete